MAHLHRRVIDFAGQLLCQLLTAPLQLLCSLSELLDFLLMLAVCSAQLPSQGVNEALLVHSFGSRLGICWFYR